MSNFIKENFKEDVFKLAEHVYKVCVNANGDAKALEWLLEKVHLNVTPSATASTSTSTTSASTSTTETTGERRALTTEKPLEEPKSSSKQPVEPNGDVNAHPDALLNALPNPLDEFMLKCDRRITD